jgi:hypothetical protein
MRRFLLFVLSFACMLALSSTPSLAQGTDANEARARELFENGSILYDEGRYNEAILAWREAWRISQRPLLLLNIANAQERLGSWREALESLNLYRVYARAEERDSLNRRIANLEERIRESETRARASAPPPQDPSVSNIGPSASTSSAASTGPGGDPVVTTATEPTTPPSSRRTWVPITLYGVGAAALGTGTVFAMLARDARSEAEGLCMGIASGEILCPVEATDALDRDRLDSILADTGFLVGGLAVIGATVFVLVDDRPGSLRLGLRPGGFSLQGSF